MIIINIKTQTLNYQGKTYAISSAKNGVGEVEGSFCTPRGKFRIAEKIGTGLPIDSVLVSRVPTGEVYSQDLAKQHTNRDWILTRILWLDGLEIHNKNTKDRYIYIHGTPDSESVGVPNSHGCIRMRNTDIINLFDLIKVDEQVVIK